jgi:hypothetical protein
MVAIEINMVSHWSDGFNTLVLSTTDRKYRVVAIEINMVSH